ncbi:alpha-galactosidase [Alloacidobacterium dinghuense]|uniref:Alpha-galactosidase n=1 Tax=Alloacidobacterium dinghuense TaxID=2763107 RepID=A0A7G8BN62_9BACT|nr:alpha-galactosidase [Alloacidobacterium dinghuense]QNI33982.1 alpha-galactosidase [Alloacidobacterium dinghuense]
MTNIDRRTFLKETGALAIGPVVSELNGLAEGSAETKPLPEPARTVAPFEWRAEGVIFSFEFLDNRLRIKSILPAGVAAVDGIPAPTSSSGVEVAIHCTGENADDHHGTKFTGGMPGGRLVYSGKEESAIATGKRMVLTQIDPVLGLKVESIYESFHDIPVLRRSTRVTNLGQREVGIEYLSSAMLHNLAMPRGYEQELLVHFAFNSWQAEGQWHALKPSEAGFLDNGNFTLSAASFNSLGTWSTQKYLPMGLVENKRLGVTWFWQIEHNGSWHWELSDTSAKAVYAYLGGPDAQHSQAWKSLRPGTIYETVPIGLGCVQGGVEQAIEALTEYRRAACIHPHSKNRQCAVIFNDYMNCLEGDPTTEKELPLIDAAAEAGCEYFVIDAGWYAELNEDWWGSVGLWQPSKTRWAPGGLKYVLDRIRSKGMIPGLWLEPEVIGIQSPLKNKPDSWFFMRHGRRVIDHSRFLLDMRNPDVRAYLDSVVDRMVGEYGVGYIKMDYNVDGLEGTELLADSFGQGLLESNRALLSWHDGILNRHHDLVIENCGSGGGRMEYAMLSHLQLQSSSDQEDYRKYPAIVVGATAGVVPEQLATWSYPKAADGPDAASFNMVNAMLCRIHQSGELARLSDDSMAQVKTGIHIYKENIRPHIPNSSPFYPLGFTDITDDRSPIALGMRSSERTFVAIWRLNGEERVHVPKLPGDLRILYPADLGIRPEREADGWTLIFPRTYMACILAS